MSMAWSNRPLVMEKVAASSVTTLIDGIHTVAQAVGWPTLDRDDGYEYDLISPQNRRAKLLTIDSGLTGMAAVQVTSFDRSRQGLRHLLAGVPGRPDLSAWANVCGLFTREPGASHSSGYRGSEPRGEVAIAAVPWVMDGAGEAFVSMGNACDSDGWEHPTWRDCWDPQAKYNGLVYCACKNGLLTTSRDLSECLHIVPWAQTIPGQSGSNNLPRDRWISSWSGGAAYDSDALLWWSGGIQGQLYDAFWRGDERPLDYVESISTSLPNGREIALQWLTYGFCDSKLNANVKQTSYLGGLKLLIPSTSPSTYDY
jgi:hypothetical protein